MGLAVTNTRDEPNGLKDVFASGFVPNFAPAPTGSGGNEGAPTGSGGNAGLGAAIGLGLSFLTPVLTEFVGTNSEAARESERLTKQIEILEKALKRVNQQTEKEKFEELTEELDFNRYLV